MTTNRMTAAERNELKTLVNERARLAMTQVRSLAADRLVELNRQLEATWAIEDFEISEMWKELRDTANTANAKIAARCDELGIHPDLRPRIHTALAAHRSTPYAEHNCDRWPRTRTRQRSNGPPTKSTPGSWRPEPIWSGRDSLQMLQCRSWRACQAPPTCCLRSLPTI
jgi:hypothetical protein